MTVSELIDKIKDYPPDAKVEKWDEGMGYFIEVASVELYGGEVWLK